MSFSSTNFYISIISSLIREIFGGVFLNFQKVVFLFIFLLLISKLHCGWRMPFFGTESLKFRFAVAWYMINFCVFEKNLCSLIVRCGDPAFLLCYSHHLYLRWLFFCLLSVIERDVLKFIDLSLFPAVLSNFALYSCSLVYLNS